MNDIEIDIEIRNLKLLVIDDSIEDINLIVPDSSFPIDVVYIGDNIRTEWNTHCQDLALNKEIEFDMLSIDILFDNDGTDPYYCETLDSKKRAINDDHICSGFYHGMMSLARRRNFDDYANSITLSWEIRSVSPEIFLKYPILSIDATRAYGFLRSFLAEPEENEELNICIEREFTGLKDKENHNYLPLYRMFQRDLSRQPSKTGSGLGAIERLLPKWRSKFEYDIQRRAIRIDSKILRNQITKFKKDMQRTDPLPSGSYYIPIAQWTDSERYGICLTSIFSDLINSNKNGIVLSWLQKLYDISPSDPFDEQLKYAKIIFDLVEKRGRVYIDEEKDEYNNKIRSCWKNMDNRARCFIYCIVLTIDRIKGDGKNDKSLANYIGITPSERTFRDPFKNCQFGDCSTASEFRKKLQNLFDGIDLFQNDSLRRAIIDYCEYRTIHISKLKKTIPGLFPD